jgi:hypothetical protein
MVGLVHADVCTFLPRLSACYARRGMHVLYCRYIMFPEAWSEGYVIPLHKKGDKNVDKYRGITLLSCLGKLFTLILNTRLTEWAELYSVYVDGQAGFRAVYDTVDNTYVLHGLITHFVNSGNMLFCSFVDFWQSVRPCGT